MQLGNPSFRTRNCFGYSPSDIFNKLQMCFALRWSSGGLGICVKYGPRRRRKGLKCQTSPYEKSLVNVNLDSNTHYLTKTSGMLASNSNDNKVSLRYRKWKLHNRERDFQAHILIGPSPASARILLQRWEAGCSWTYEPKGKMEFMSLSCVSVPIDVYLM